MSAHSHPVTCLDVRRQQRYSLKRRRRESMEHLTLGAPPRQICRQEREPSCWRRCSRCALTRASRSRPASARSSCASALSHQRASASGRRGERASRRSDTPIQIDFHPWPINPLLLLPSPLFVTFSMKRWLIQTADFFFYCLHLKLFQRKWMREIKVDVTR